MDANRKQTVRKDIMFNTGRRSAISSSELGLYSDHSDYYNTSAYGATVRKLVIGIMVVVSVILIGIFLYDFVSSASISSKVNQETKHIYILQNTLRKPSNNNATKKSTVTLAPTIYIVNRSDANVLEDRVDNDQSREYKDESSLAKPETRTQRMAVDDNAEPESRTQNLMNFKVREVMLDKLHNADENEAPGHREKKQMIDNHAMIYRVRQKHPETVAMGEESVDEKNQRATPFRFELKGPHPSSFKRPKYPQLTQYRYPHTSRNIQDIIKYLTNDPETLNRGIKFTGYYVNPKKYDTEIGEVAMNSDRSEEQENPPYAIALNADPLFPYKPKHPSDVNLLAPSNFRFSPTVTQRYNPYYDPYYHRTNANKPSAYQENQYDSLGTFGATNFGKRRKPKPFSVMLDIYPITDVVDQTKKSFPLKPQIPMDDSELRRPFVPFFTRYPKVYGTQTQSQHPFSVSGPVQQQEEEEKHQMILHLNLYPKRKSKLTRNDVIQRSEVLPANEKEQLIDRIMAPFDAITKHLADNVSDKEIKQDKNENSPLIRYEETLLAKDILEPLKNFKEKGVKAKTEKLIATTQINNCDNDCETSTILPDVTTTLKVTAQTRNYVSSTDFKDIDTIEAFQKFADSLIAMD